MVSIFPQQQSKQPFFSRNPSGLASLFVIVARRERRAECKKNESEPTGANFCVSHFSSARLELRVDDGPDLVSLRGSTQIFRVSRGETATASLL